jgi:citrate lyase beta subunit
VSAEDPRAAWVKALKTQLRAARNHDAAAAFHAKFGFSDLAARELERAAEERRGYDATLARHPEWVAAAPPRRRAPATTLE